MPGTCWAYDGSAPPEVRKALRREGNVGEDKCILADCGGKHCSPHGEDVCHYGPDGKKKKPAGGRPRQGLRSRPRSAGRASPFSLATGRRARNLPRRPGKRPRRKG